jgi:hypothetical protein
LEMLTLGGARLFQKILWLMWPAQKPQHIKTLLSVTFPETWTQPDGGRNSSVGRTLKKPETFTETHIEYHCKDCPLTVKGTVLRNRKCLGDGKDLVHATTADAAHITLHHTGHVI